MVPAWNENASFEKQVPTLKTFSNLLVFFLLLFCFFDILLTAISPKKIRSLRKKIKQGIKIDEPLL